jgi:hypothetical protein
MVSQGPADRGKNGKDRRANDQGEEQFSVFAQGR